jgi:hypothetical protein
VIHPTTAFVLVKPSDADAPPVDEIACPGLPYTFAVRELAAGPRGLTTHELTAPNGLTRYCVVSDRVGAGCSCPRESRPDVAECPHIAGLRAAGMIHTLDAPEGGCSRTPDEDLDGDDAEGADGSDGSPDAWDDDATWELGPEFAFETIRASRDTWAAAAAPGVPFIRRLELVAWALRLAKTDDTEWLAARVDALARDAAAVDAPDGPTMDDRLETLAREYS